MIAEIDRQLPPPPGRDPDAPRPMLPPPRDRDGAIPPVQPARTRTMVFIVIGLAIVLLGLLAFGVITRVMRNHALAGAANQQQNTPPQVFVMHAARASDADLSLAATTQGIQDAVIYARTSGYISKRYVDLGDPVKAGQLLAEIASPEIDQQLAQARADLKSAEKNLQVQQATLNFAEVTVNRYKSADKEGAVAKEDVDQRISAYQTAQASVAAAEAAVTSAQANVGRLIALTGFERVTAPFDGTVLQRSIDVGTLVTAGSPTNNTSVAPSMVSGAAAGLFEIGQIDTLRVFVNVPQVIAPNVKPGLPVDVAVRGQLNRPVPARVARTAQGLDPSTRTLLTEVDIPNATRALLPGMFVYVSFKVGPSGTRWRIPDTALIFNERGTQVVIVEQPENKIRMRPVVVGRDFGNAVDIQSGIDGSQWIVKQPTVSLQEGQVVTPEQSKEPPTG
jgi:membrane fusion protein (multidrug efflux system)